MTKTYTDVLRDEGFVWNRKEEYWVKKLGFGRSVTVDVQFKNLFMIRTDNKVIHDNYIDTFTEFQEVMKKIC
jgi:hypothetical protein